MTQKDKDAVIAALEELKGDGTGLVAMTVEDCIAVVNGLPVGDGWTAVTEGLPEDDLPKGSKVKQIKVLTALRSDNGVRTVRSQMRYRMTWYNSAPWAWKLSGSEITHWMPLPEPPKGGKTDA